MGTIDIIAAVGLLIFLLIGMRRGIAGEFFGLLLLLIVFIIAQFLHPMLVNVVERFAPVNINGARIVFVVAFFVIYSLLSMIFSGLINKIGRIDNPSAVSRIFGGVVGLAKGVVYVGMLLWFTISVGPKDLSDQIFEGVIAKHTIRTVSVMYDKVEGFIREYKGTPFTVINQ